MNSRYLERALQDELSILRSKANSRNDQVNKSAFSLGQLCGPEGLDKNEVERLLRQAAEENGYVEKDGLRAVLGTIRSGLEAGMKSRGLIPNGDELKPQGAHRKRPRRAVEARAVDAEARARRETAASDVQLPDWTPPGRRREAVFKDVGKTEPAPIKGEIRRHRYLRGGNVVRVKIKYQTADGGGVDE